ncbi:hypothetical protein [Myxosarcina sp. GI1]|uniref:hypothetical protein n=1 Tax=Myxosarcina sp. GI1 TaxID=1541065 RepID=UPI0005659000|nr:hypothetical protein [Myxosarcina sp. GI1]
MKLKKLVFPIAIAITCSSGIVLAEQIIMEAGEVTIVKEENGSIEVDTGNTQMRVPQRSIEHEIEDDYSINNSAINSSTSRQINHDFSCRTRTVQSTHQSNNSGSKQTVTQTNISTNICQ